ncbi:MAG: hypothetical protein COV47_02835 [Candidatus Diapherotrites archaeon CG11_big_fil_rev_8_21_14_0_20_37_9]|nr:MAG: hypothetical protein COV47_02835 [Candidatus Diapherotrites archaeon CG11_big_fil_rev_8_21_14_0_20_37_9]
MIFRKALIIVLLLVFAAFTPALLLKSEKNSYSKGDSIVLSGFCDSGENRISAETEGKIVFDEQVICDVKGFKFSYPTTFLDPSGSWKITLSSPETESSVLLRVEPTSDSAFFRITFLSPAEFNFSRGEFVFVSVEVLDAGEPVDNAQVVFFDAFSRKINLKNSGNGIYDLNYSVPYNAPTGQWNLLVVAQKETDSGKIIGGERKIPAEISPARFDFVIIEPSKPAYEQSDAIPFKFNVFYPNGTKLDSTNLKQVEVIAGDQNYIAELNTNNEYVLSYIPNQSGNIDARIIATDTAGNESQYSVQVTVTCPITCFLKNWGLIILVFVLVVAIITRLFYHKTKLNLELMRLKSEKEKTTQLIKNLQLEYFGKGIMPSSSYKSNLLNYKSKLIEIDEQLNQLQKKLSEEK